VAEVELAAPQAAAVGAGVNTYKPSRREWWCLCRFVDTAAGALALLARLPLPTLKLKVGEALTANDLKIVNGEELPLNGRYAQHATPCLCDTRPCGCPFNMHRT
jgi:hypothetical protein